MATRRPLGNLAQLNNQQPSLKQSHVKQKSVSSISKNAHCSTSLHQQQIQRSKSYDNEQFVEIQEHRKSRERDEVTGEPKYTTIHRYFRGKMLGKGGFAKVYVATVPETKKKYAIKIVPKANLVKSRARAKLQAEIRIHRSLNNEHICKFKHYFEDGVNCYIMLELCHNQSMNEMLKRRKRLTEPEVLYFMQQVVRGTQYMHSISVIHRDLKLGNLFLDKDMRVKIGDLGLAAKLSHPEERRKTICGTPNYIAPEIIDGKNKEIGHTYHVDLWSTGVVMFALLCGKPPFESKDVKSTYKRILDIEYSYPNNVNVSSNSKHVIDSLLQRIPEDRLSLHDILQHPAMDNRRTFIPENLEDSCLHKKPEWDIDELFSDSKDLLPSFSRKVDKASSSLSTSVSKSSSTNPNNNALQSNRSSTKSILQVQSVGKVLSHRNQNKPPTRRALSIKKQPSSVGFEIYGDEGLHGNEQKENIDPERRDDNIELQRSSKSDLRHRSGCSSSSNRYTSPSLARSMSRDICDLSTRTSTMKLGDVGDRVLVRSKMATKEANSKLSSNQTNLPYSNQQRSSFASKLSSADGFVPPSINTAKSSSTASNMLSNPYIVKDTDIEVLESMHMRLVRAEKIQSGESISVTSPQPKTNEGNASIWVSRYVDYTSKYGLGFLLSDGSAGVCFNDSTKAVISAVSDRFNYIERRKSRQVDVIPEEHSLSNYPHCLEKKVLLLKHFRNYLVEQEKRASPSKQEVDKYHNDSHLMGGINLNTGEYIEKDMVYVKKWVRTRHAILFRLSDRTVQVVFFDHTEIILSAGARLVTYVDKSGGRTTFSLNNIATEANVEIAKRLRYSKDIMHQLITGQSPEETS